ncbi:MAG: AMP-binding protein [Peptostreptococcales bacterium]
MMNTKPLYETRKIVDLRDMLYTSAIMYSNKNAFMVKDKPGAPYRGISFQQFLKDVEALGTAMLAHGFKDQKIAVIGENRYEWAVAYMAVVCGLGVVVPLDKELPAEEIQNLVQMAGVETIIYSGKFENIFQSSGMWTSIKNFINMDGIQHENNHMAFSKLIGQGNQMIDEGYKGFQELPIDTEVMNMLLYTSGTTSTAKGVMLSHRNIVSNLMAMATMVYIDSSDIFFSILPIHHTYECTCGFLLPLYKGATIAYCEGLKYILKNMEEAKPTVLLTVPLVIEQMYKKIWKKIEKEGLEKKVRKAIKLNNSSKKIGIDLSKKLFKKIHQTFGGNIRMFIIGGSAVDPEVMLGLIDLGILTFQGYGLTESSPIVAVNPDIRPIARSAGQIIPGAQVMIVNPNEEGIGEIITKSDSIMLGYYNNKEATEESIKDGWYYTGDLGYLDSNNYVYITGRKKNVIIAKNGKNIYPEEVEFYLGRSKYIEESMVWGKLNDETGETHIYASIRPNYEEIEEEFGNDYGEDEVFALIQKEVDLINSQLAYHKKIRKINIKQDEFIKTTTRKIKRHLEKEKLEEIK